MARTAPGPFCQRPGCRNPGTCTHSAAKTARMLRRYRPDIAHTKRRPASDAPQEHE